MFAHLRNHAHCRAMRAASLAAELSARDGNRLIQPQKYYQMKKLLTLGAFLLATAGAFAGSGKAIVPSITYYRNGGVSDHFLATVIAVTNITDHPVTVTPFFYDKDGNLLPNTWLNFSNFTSSNTQLAARSTGWIQVAPPAGTSVASSMGFGTIEWTNLPGNNDTVALVGHGYSNYLFGSAGRESKWAIPVNAGLPF
jgi:hypothetical protein